MTDSKSRSNDGRLRSFWQVLAVYIGASWVVLQVVDVVKDNMGLPGWVFPFAVVLLLIGLPIMLATAMIQGRPGRQVETVSVSQSAAPVDGRDERSTHRLFTWRNALIGGAAAFVLLTLVTAGFMFMRNRGIGPVGSLVAKGVLDERGKVILADFEASDPEIARAATEAFRVDLAQSDIVTLVEPDSIEDALQRMGRAPDEPLSEETARELGVRDGVPAVISGELSSVGGGFALSARLVASDDGGVLASARASARDSSGVLDAIDIVSSKLREQIGESYTSLRESPPLAHVTTSSLEALRRYTQAVDARHKEGNMGAAIALLEDAVAIDTAFALAYRDLATILGNTRGSWDRRIDALESAYRHRDRLTERERYLVEASYHQDVEADRPRTIQVYEAMLRLDPSDAQALNNIGYNYWLQGDFVRAGEYYRRAREADPSETIYAANAATAWAQIGEIERADSAYAVLDEMPRSPTFESWRAFFEYQRGDEPAAREKLATLAEDYASRPGDVAYLKGSLGNFELLHGRLRSAEALLDEQTGIRVRQGVASADLTSGLWMAFRLLEVVRDTAGAMAQMERALEETSLEELPVLDRPWVWAARIAARAGDPDRARELLARRDSEVSPRYLEIARQDEHDLAAWIALAEGNAERALEELRRQPPEACTRCRSVDFARLFERSGQADSAIARYEEYLQIPSNFAIFIDATALGAVYESLGHLYDERGDLEEAALYYAQFLDLWAEADSELQPRVQAARARMEEIVRERG
jgi:tetratricopeptide (TPR) repeat protein